jgi:hypothetical protein
MTTGGAGTTGEIAASKTENCKLFSKFFEIGAWKRARGYFGAADRLRDFEIL